MVGGTPEDDAHNSFVFDVVHDPVDGADLVILKTMIDSFYNVNHGTAPMVAYMSNAISKAADAAVIRFYNITGHLDGSPHGAPIGLRTFTMGATTPGSVSLPEGVAAALSYHSAYGTDVEFGVGTRPRARDRGRLYLGPLNTQSLYQDPATYRASLSDTFRADAIQTCAALLSASVAATKEWKLWSRKSAALKTIVGGWVDDRFDYQRRREDQGTVRDTWTA